MDKRIYIMSLMFIYLSAATVAWILHGLLS